MLNMHSVKVTERLRFFIGGWSNSLALGGPDGVFVIDAKLGNWTREMRSDIHAELGQVISRLMLTHSHVDHAGGLPQFREVRSVIAHPRTRVRVEQQTGLRGEPWIEVNDSLHLLIGDEPVWIYYLGRGHTDGDLVALLPNERLVATGDLFTNGYAPRIDVEAGGSALELEKTLAKLLTLDFDRVLPGHGDPVGRAALERFHRYFADMKAEVANALARGETEDQVAGHVTLDAYSDYGPLLNVSSREMNVRQMYRDLTEAGRKAP
jgi:cyclase